jgi:hypothetical protein
MERGLGQQHQKFFTAVPALQVRAAQHFPHALADRIQHRVAAQVAVSIVDVLEVVEIKQDHRDRHLAAPGASQLGVDDVQRVAASEAAGQRILDAVVLHFTEQLRILDRNRQQRCCRFDDAPPIRREQAAGRPHAQDSQRGAADDQREANRAFRQTVRCPVGMARQKLLRQVTPLQHVFGTPRIA